MREKLNNNPMLQAVLLGLLLVAAGIFVLSPHGGEEEEGGGEAATTSVAVSGAATGGETLSALPASTSSDVPVPPHAVTAAWNHGKTVVLLFVRDGGIDDHVIAAATRRLAGMPGVASFVLPASRIARYAAITEGVGVQRVPALLVLRPKSAGQTVPTASVQYGFQSAASIRQAVIDAGYRGPTLDYHP